MTGPERGLSPGMADSSGAKPSIDLLSSSGANAYASNLVAVVLSGTGSDGATGARAVHDGGTVIIQKSGQRGISWHAPVVRASCGRNRATAAAVLRCRSAQLAHLSTQRGKAPLLGTGIQLETLEETYAQERRAKERSVPSTTATPPAYASTTARARSASSLSRRIFQATAQPIADGQTATGVLVLRDISSVRD